MQLGTGVMYLHSGKKTLAGLWGMGYTGNGRNREMGEVGRVKCCSISVRVQNKRLRKIWRWN